MTAYIFREATPADVEATIELRGKTRENPVSREKLEHYGINYQSLSAAYESGVSKGYLCTLDGVVVGFCNGDASSGEILVLAVAPEHEGEGIGKQLLSRVSVWLFSSGCSKIWLAADPDSSVRAHGFYRHCGWKPTGEMDDRGDEILQRRSTKTSSL
jgi:ribosomal protein S18 acetylase RimI-like enzyme